MKKNKFIWLFGLTVTMALIIVPVIVFFAPGDNRAGRAPRFVEGDLSGIERPHSQPFHIRDSADRAFGIEDTGRWPGSGKGDDTNAAFFKALVNRLG